MNEPTEGGKAVIGCCSLRLALSEFLLFFMGLSVLPVPNTHLPTEARRRYQKKVVSGHMGAGNPNRFLCKSWYSKPLSRLSSPLPILLKSLLDTE